NPPTAERLTEFLCLSALYHPGSRVSILFFLIFIALNLLMLLFNQVCAFTAQTVRKRTGRKHPAHREAIGMAGCRYCSAEG
ncbi:MAG TPA: hypothetical protein H9831_04650, partial [Candidatus Eisenbergiella pullistercoris]|nr:hypothetical protein [Candidatus Eisenbergiella pullistercoris]